MEREADNAECVLLVKDLSENMDSISAEDVSVNKPLSLVSTNTGKQMSEY